MPMTLENSQFPTDAHGWAEMLPTRIAGAPLNGNHRVPWVVVGAGFTGLACARRLAAIHPNVEILLLDARLVGQGASGRNSGYAVATSHFPGGMQAAHLDNYRRVNRINRVGLKLLREQVAEHSIDCQWCERGIYHTAADRQSLVEFEYFKEYVDSLEIDHQLLDQNALLGQLGTGLYKAGVHVSDGALVQPAALVRGLADSLPDNVRLHEHSPVLALEKARPFILRLPRAEIAVDKIVMAMNYEAASLGFLRSRVVGSTLSGSVTRVLTAQELADLGTEPEWGVLSLHSGGATVRLTRDHRLCLRNTAEYHAGRLMDDKMLASRQEIHRAAFDKRFPQLARVPFEYAWSGVEGISRNGTNFFGQQADNLFLAGGYNGSGVSRGTAFGSAIAEYASGVESPLVDDCLASVSAAWIPPRPLRDIGAFFTVRSRFRGVGRDR